MQARVREASEQRREIDLMMAEDIMGHMREKSSQGRALAELHSHLESVREQVTRRGQQLDEKRRRLLAEKNRFFQSASVLHKRHQAPW